MIKTLQNLISPIINKETISKIECHISKSMAIVLPLNDSFKYANTKQHTHPSYMFILPLDEFTTLNIQGKDYQTTEQTLFCLSPDIKHHELKSYIPPKYCTVFIEATVFEDLMKEYNPIKKHFIGEEYKLLDNKLNYFIKEFISESKNDSTLSNSIKELYSELIIHHILKMIFPIKEKINTNTTHKTLNKLLLYIDTHYNEDISLNELSNIVKLSSTHINRLFQSELKISPMQYLIQVRLEQAKKLLLSSEFTITKIASKCGFNSSAYFSKMFKKYYNATPKEFVKLLNG